jgi:hypothetical protein
MAIPDAKILPQERIGIKGDDFREQGMLYPWTMTITLAAGAGLTSTGKGSVKG